MREWIGVDFDGTLAVSGTKVWNGPLGEPIPLMVDRVKGWIAEGIEVRIFTARVAPYNKDGSKQSVAGLSEIRTRLSVWCLKNVGMWLDITCEKDHNVIEIWDDKVVGVIRDTGIRIGDPK